jgi:hypothetical protein
MFTFRNKNISFQFSNGDLRHIILNGTIIIQRVYFAVRDEVWLNIEPLFQNFSSSVVGCTTIYSFDLLFQKNSVNLTVHLIIRINTDDRKFQIDARGIALSDFKKNRIGLCLHLPSSLKGSPCDILHSDGSTSSTKLPILISPHQPIQNIGQMELKTDHLTAKFVFEGDLFEMEDQRNWTDASYKIYSTPLEFPFPVEVKKGDLFHQKISVTISPVAQIVKYPQLGDLSYKRVINSLPLFGTIIPDNFPLEYFNYIFNSGRFPFSYLRIDFHLYRNYWEEKIRKHIAFAKEKNIPIYAILYFSEHYENEMKDFLSFYNKLDLHDCLRYVVLLSSIDFVLPDSILGELIPRLRTNFSGIRIGTGTDANFAQLNRDRPSTKEFDFLCYAIHPQEHASDMLSIIENIKGQSDTVVTAQSFANSKPIHISSLSLFRRFNANVEKIKSDNRIDNYPFAVSNFETGWFIGALNELIRVGIEAITAIFYPLDNSSLFILFQKIANHPPEYFITDSLKTPMKYSMLSWQSKGKIYSVIANLTDDSLSLRHEKLSLKLAPHEIQYIENEIEYQGE